MSVISTIASNFIQIGLEVWFCACVISHPSVQSDSADFFFWGGVVLEKGYHKDAHTDFDRKISQTTPFRARKCLLVVAKL